MPPLIGKILAWPLSARLLLAANIGYLLFALTMQFGFGDQPCILCLWQRIPYGAAAVFSALALVWKPQGRRTAALLGLCALVYLAGMGLGIFHTGVEQHWWLGTSGCTVQPLRGSSPEELRQSLLQTISPPCDKISWTIFGFSMANLNIAFSLALAFFAAAAAAKAARE
ncbi:MAG: disulfide bond formation protein B [Alphaproteobacteria bacterium]|nr:disulfide bond formation protein B [Alphaproteobacteria bacterium]